MQKNRVLWRALFGGLILASSGLQAKVDYSFFGRGLLGANGAMGPVNMADSTYQTSVIDAQYTYANLGKQTVTGGFGLGFAANWSNCFYTGLEFNMTWAQFSDSLSAPEGRGISPPTIFFGAPFPSVGSAYTLTKLQSRKPAYHFLALLGIQVSPKTLLYIPIGIAWRNFSASLDYFPQRTSPATSYISATNKMFSGFTVGAGIDYNLTKSIALGVQTCLELYGKKTFTSSIPVPTGTYYQGAGSYITLTPFVLTGLLSLKYSFHL